MSKEFPTLLTGMVEHHGERANGIQTTSFSLSGDNHMNGIVQVVAADYNWLTERPVVTRESAAALLGKKVTFVRALGGAFGHQEIMAMPGTVIDHRGEPAFLPKGKRTNGYKLSQWLDNGTLIDVEMGYGGVDILQARVNGVRARYPKVEALTKDHFLALHSRSNTCSLAIFGTYPFLGEKAVGTIWFCHSYMRGDDTDIVENMLCIRPEYGESEHGSAYGRDLLRMNVGVVKNFEPIAFKDAIDLDYDNALALVAPKVQVPA